MSDFSGTGLTCIRGERVVFSSLDFTIAAGEALYLLGHNGAGKSSLLRTMAGFLRPAEGTLAWDGEALSEDPAAHRRRVHYVGHHDAIKGVLTVEENVAFWAGLHGNGNSTARDALDRFGLAPLAKSPARFLSAGQRRRLNLARLLASEAPLWLLDEPTTALDRESITTLTSVIADHRAAGGLIAIATHEDPDPGANTLIFGPKKVTEEAA